MMVIAIDGPAGSGKSTIARAVASRLGVGYLDTGAMYRSIAFAILERGIDPGDPDSVSDVAGSIDIIIESGRVCVDGVDATSEIRGSDVSNAVSVVAANPEVRTVLVKRQRQWAADHDGGVLEGRDIGTVVFPDATLKVYLTARPDVRAARRSNQIEEVSVEAAAGDIARRDFLDSTREVSPLSQASDAVTIDTSDFGIDEVVDKIIALIP